MGFILRSLYSYSSSYPSVSYLEFSSLCDMLQHIILAVVICSALGQDALTPPNPVRIVAPPAPPAPISVTEAMSGPGKSATTVTMNGPGVVREPEAVTKEAIKTAQKSLDLALSKDDAQPAAAATGAKKPATPTKVTININKPAVTGAKAKDASLKEYKDKIQELKSDLDVVPEEKKEDLKEENKDSPVEKLKAKVGKVVEKTKEKLEEKLEKAEKTSNPEKRKEIIKKVEKAINKEEKNTEEDESEPEKEEKIEKLKANVEKVVEETKEKIEEKLEKAAETSNPEKRKEIIKKVEKA